ncbi:MAG TPA: hypothetical protein VL947_06625, partial [Cytophagales bacterium]|nr:hypothetical protein [Cytophagales bacterium]
MKNIILKIGIFLLGLICLRVQAVDIPVTTVSGIDAAITQANATTAVDRIVLRIPGFAYGTRITATIMITQPLVIDGSELTGYQKYFPVAELALPSRDTSKSITIKGLAVNTAYQLTNNVGPNTIRNNMAFVDCNVFNVGNSLSFDDRSVMIKHVRKVSFKGCVFNYYLFLNKTQFGKGDVYERITVYKSADVVFGGNTESEANVIVGFHKKGVFLYKCKNVQFNTNYIGVLPAALAALPIVITYHTDTYTITDGQDGIYLSTCHQITIGGGSSGQSTVIGNMATNGIYMTKCSDITIQNSKIGVAADGVTRTANMNGIVAASPLHKYSGNASTELLGWQGSESDTDPA